MSEHTNLDTARLDLVPAFRMSLCELDGIPGTGVTNGDVAQRIRECREMVFGVLVS